eukprot:5617416-Amphidinium_carterae.1
MGVSINLAVLIVHSICMIEFAGGSKSRADVSNWELAGPSVENQDFCMADFHSIEIGTLYA